MGNIPYFRTKKIAKGKVAYYFEIPKHKRVEGWEENSKALGSEKYKAQQEALRIYNEFQEFKHRKDFRIPKSLDYIWNRYKETRLYIDLAERTKKDYNRAYTLLCRIENKSGKKLKDIPLDLFDFHSADKQHQILVKLYKPRWAKNCMSLLRLMFNYGKIDKIFPDNERNPFENLRIKVEKAKKKYIPRNDIQAIINEAKKQEKKFGDNAVSLAVELNYYFGQRPADIFELRKEHIYQKDNYYFFRIKQNKTGTIVNALIPPRLVDVILEKEDFIICDKQGKPFSVDRFGRRFKAVNDVLGFDYTYSLLRHSASTAYKEAGVDTSAVISLTGHTNESIFNNVYKANSEPMMISMYKQREEHEDLQQENNENHSD